ncbi:unnamed protein product [Caenorhabditis angaria]|uniref:Potassium channel domain-containing protein n=1 Tax=Caenorhabditis angaria TaxID=860376 RepID=A0A9P1IIN3_9PELO|nr:unnamed protein product [Caenorhabditis angaria]
MAMFLSQTMKHASPTTTVLADGYTDDALNSKYDNYRASRPYSRESLLSGTSLGSKVRLSQFSLLSRPDATTAEEDNEEDDENHYNQRKFQEQKNLLQNHVLKMFAGQFSRNGSFEVDDLDLDKSSSTSLPSAPPPKSFLAKCKYYYDKYKLHRVSACICLIFYSFFGAWLFYLVEHDYEKTVKLKEKQDLYELRSKTLQKLIKNTTAFNAIFQDFEYKLHKIRLPECLDWDYWGALFYVGTLFTTIGYGNIAPRTGLGRAMSIIYAIIGIPLVLAILSKCGKWLTTTLSIQWQQHRRRIKLKAKKTTNRLRGRKISKLEALEAGISDMMNTDTDEPESRTIPIWLALSICILFVCGCSSLFLIWETKWTFFTSLYFFCISLSTIGLGDIVPDHPHMFIIMFVLVILGLSIVSMLLSVIQIKMEEWLYHLIKKIQQEYNRALENGEIIDKDGLFRNVMSNEPTWMQLVAPTMLTGQQTDKLEQKVEQFERLLKESKDVQTDLSVAYVGTQVERFEQSMACDPMTDKILPQHRETQWSCQQELHLQNDDRAPITSRSFDYRDSISDATSLPIDSMSSPKMALRKHGNSARPGEDQCCQTDLAQFQIDEIAIKLASLQTQRVRPPIVERSMATSAYLDSPAEEQVLLKNGLSNADISALCEVISTSYHGSNPAEVLSCLVDRAVGGSEQEINRVMEKSQCTSDPGVDDKSQCTSLSIATLAKKLSHDKSQCTSLSESSPQNVKKTSTSDKSQCTSLCLSSDKQDKSQCTSISKDPTKKKQSSISTSMDKLFKSTSTSPMNSQAEKLKKQRSFATSPVPIPQISIAEEETQTSLHQTIDAFTQPSTSHSTEVATEMSLSEDISHKKSKRDQSSSPISQNNDDRSIQTSISEWFGKIFKGKDQSQQTSLAEDLKRKKSTTSTSTSDDSISEPHKRKNNSMMMMAPPTIMSSSCTMSTQYSPPPGCERNDNSRLSEPTHRARSSSTSGIGTSIFEEETRQEVIVQTDDSYLKIARRLDEYRNNKTQFLPVCAASPLSSKEVEPFKTDRPSERSHYYFGSRRSSLGRSRKKSRFDQNSAMGKSMDTEMLNDVLNENENEEESPPREQRKKSVNFAETPI